MKHSLSSTTAGKRQTLAAFLLAALAAWRLPTVFGLKAGNPLFAANAMTLVLAAGLFCLLKAAFACRDRRLMKFSCGLGLLFACLTVVGEHVKLNDGFLPATWLSVADGVLLTALFGVIFGAAPMLLFQCANRACDASTVDGKESVFSKLLGNGFLMFAVLLLCWLPAWLACWPGTFAADSVTQYYQYIDELFSAHHPLLHTLLLGFCMTAGAEASELGESAMGLALYSLVQMVLMAAIVGYACRWLRRRKAPLWARVGVTALFALFPLYGLWSFSAQKDVLFAGLTLLFVTQLADLWQDGYALLRKPLRIAAFVLIAVLMMLFRNNGVYALCLLAPFAILAAKGARLRVTALLAGCIAVYLLSNGLLVRALDATAVDKVEMLSIPLQQLARTLRDDPDALTNPADRELIDTLYCGENPSDYYSPEVSDPVKWATDYELVDENVAPLLITWARVGVTHLKSYAEAFLIQNLPYLLPGANPPYNFDLGLADLDINPIEADSKLPELLALYTSYDQTLTVFGLPMERLLSDTAFYVWVCMACLALALYRRQRQWIAALGFVLAIWLTCLLGPIALMRYMLGAFYAVPVLAAGMMGPWNKPIGK